MGKILLIAVSLILSILIVLCLFGQFDNDKDNPFKNNKH